MFFFSFWNTDYLVGCPTQLTCLFIILENGTVASWKHDDWWYGTFWMIYYKSAVIKYFSKMSFIGSCRILHIWQIFKFQILTIDCSLCSCPWLFWNLTAIIKNQSPSIIHLMPSFVLQSNLYLNSDSMEDKVLQNSLHNMLYYAMLCL